jgi:hypothetical protein
MKGSQSISEEYRLGIYYIIKKVLFFTFNFNKPKK